MINGFRGEYYFLSNFSPSKIEYEGYTYLNAEAAFHAQKNDSSTYKYLMQFQPPNAAKREGRKVPRIFSVPHRKDDEATPHAASHG